jgi:hypothetical protein
MPNQDLVNYGGYNYGYGDQNNQLAVVDNRPLKIKSTRTTGDAHCTFE